MTYSWMNAACGSFFLYMLLHTIVHRSARYILPCQSINFIRMNAFKSAFSSGGHSNAGSREEAMATVKAVSASGPREGVHVKNRDFATAKEKGSPASTASPKVPSSATTAAPPIPPVSKNPPPDLGNAPGKSSR